MFAKQLTSHHSRTYNISTLNIKGIEMNGRSFQEVQYVSDN